MYHRKNIKQNITNFIFQFLKFDLSELDVLVEWMN